MRVSHNDAIVLEGIVCRVYGLHDRGGMGGYIDADHFESQPFDAALLALAPLWNRADFHELEDFLIKWEDVFRRDNTEEIGNDSFVNELDSFVSRLCEE